MSNKWIGLGLSALLVGCGGGGGSDEPQQVVDNGGLTVSGPEQVNLGDGAAFIVRANGASLSQAVRWRQISGPQLNIVNPNSPLASFAVTTSGTYQLQVDVGDASANVSFSSGAISDSIASYSDQQVVSNGRVSLRAEALDDFGQSYPSNLSWQQVSGPAVSNLGNEEPQLLTFSAPNVTQDTELVFELSGSANGVTGTDRVSVWVTADPAPAPNAFFDGPLARVQPYRSNSPYAAALSKCVYSTQLNQECSIAELPLIGQNSAEPSIDEILDRVVVSHPWMGAQLEYLLRNNDNNGDFRRLLSAVTAVVISSDVRPSFYWVVTGAIYLDPDNLWEHPWQRASINEDPDYRSGFGSELQFLMPWRFVNGNDYASLYYPPGVKLSRPWQQVLPDLTSLMYHELAHANDFFPRSLHSSMGSGTLLQLANDRYNSKTLVSDSLDSSYGLSSDTMRGLAQVSFQGAQANSSQKALSAEDVAQQFFADRASDFYAYSTPREDLAVLVEETMMQHRYNIHRDVAVTSGRSTNPALDLIVAQGQRGRVGATELTPRVQLVFDALLPELGNISNELDPPQTMIRGLSWFDAINFATPTANAGVNSVLQSKPQSPLQGRFYLGSRHDHQRHQTSNR
ncbi:hypothetical protein [uncultured Ferrimonas sp.]|uniref:PKD domain-containing protein n=1 Tax=uncultured Ferrimonas sp. TaxID=432640 RepID=UPI0026056BD1|nr:hypothetical protein [uncultured Ferrimonas sp.]